jgi:hypothetical protein
MSQISHFPGTVFIVAASLIFGKEVNKGQGPSVVIT